MSTDWIKVFKLAPHAVLMVVKEPARGGACRAVRRPLSSLWGC